MVRLAVALDTTLEYLREGETIEDSYKKIEERDGPLDQEITFDVDSDVYERLLVLCEQTGKSLPEIVRETMLLGYQAMKRDKEASKRKKR